MAADVGAKLLQDVEDIRLDEVSTSLGEIGSLVTRH